MKKIFTVKEFVAKWKEGYVSAKDFITDSYVPYEEKDARCRMIIDKTYYTKDTSGNKTFKVNSPAKYMMFCLVFIDTHTNIKINYKKNLDDFNLLNQTDFLDKLITEIPHEYKEFKMILDMTEDDLYKNKYEIHSYINEQITRIEKIASILSSSTTPAIEQLVEKLDAQSLKTLVDKIQK